MKKIGTCSMIIFFAILLLSVALWASRKSTADEVVDHSEFDTTTNIHRVESVPDLPMGWTQLYMLDEDLAQGTLILVNRDYFYDSSIPQTVSVYEHKTDHYFVRDTLLGIQEQAMDSLNEWMHDFATETGRKDINIVSGWRSYDEQSRLYQNAVDTKGQDYADIYLSLPGHSEHHTGLAVDLDTFNLNDGTSGGFDGEGAYMWAVEHAWEYGFVQRYPQQKSEITGIAYESWHYRYVGLPHAYIMNSKNLCLEEYIDYLKRYPYSGEHLYASCNGVSYEIYYCYKDCVIVPTDNEYLISGNNVDGFIITILRAV